MKKYIFPIFTLFAIHSYSQQEVKGIILHQDQSPAPYVDVILLTDHKIIDEVSTDENGIFKTFLENGNYILRIEESGIALHTQSILIAGDKEIGVIVLPNQENITLKETVVTGQKKLIEKKVDRLIFNPDLAEGAKGGNALDALRLAPRIKVDESTDAVSIIGKGSVTVMINDRLMQMDQTQLANYLKTIRTEDIEKIEIITNPPAKYDASGNSGVINIVTKTAKDESINGSLSTSYSRALADSFNHNGNLNFRKDKWTFTSRLYNGNGEWKNHNRSEIIYPTTYWESKVNNQNKNKYLGGGIGIDYQLNKKLITGFNLDLSNGKGTNESSYRTNIFNQPDKNLDRYIFNDNKGTSWDWSYVGFNYHIIQKFNEEGKKLTFDFDYSNNSNLSHNMVNSNEFNADNTPINNKDQGNETITDLESNRYNVSIDMEHPINSWKMNYGTRLRFGNDTANNNRLFRLGNTPFIEDPSYKYAITYQENIYALYYSIEKQFNDKWTAKLGLRYEHADVNGKSNEQNIDFKKTYDGLFPTAYLMYEPAENHSLSLNYSRRVDRPMLWSLNPMLIKINDYTYSQGNLDLVPSYSQNLEFEYAYKDLSVTSIYYRHTSDLTTNISFSDADTQITIDKLYNFGKTYSIGVSENINVKPLKWWKINASADVYYIKTTGTIPERNYVLDGINGEFQLTNNLELNKKKTLFANYSFSYQTSGSDQDMDSYDDFMRHNLGFRALLFNKKLQLSLNINNLFENRNVTYSSYTNNIYSSFTSEAFRTYRIGLTYNFGKQFNIERSKSNQEQSGGSGGKG